MGPDQFISSSPLTTNCRDSTKEKKNFQGWDELQILATKKKKNNIKTSSHREAQLLFAQLRLPLIPLKSHFGAQQ